MKNAKVINNLRQYWKFCQDSAGFFPQSWLDYYFHDCVDLLQINEKKIKGEQVISASLDRIHKNIEFLPFVYEAIINKRVLEIDYKPYDEEQVTLLFHPHFLKEYNGRWHLFGHAEGREPENGYDLALDRIQSRPREKDKMEYIAAPPMFYQNRFEDMVGVSHMENPIIDDIIVRAHSFYIFNLLKTKPLHRHQDVKNEFGEYEDGVYGEFIVHVEVNNEFIGRILQMGAGLEIRAPKEVRDLFCERVRALGDLYK
jgi:predicted DNA-binding transcriptional regulator YafY